MVQVFKTLGFKTMPPKRIKTIHFKIRRQAPRHQWLTHVILATWEAEIRRIKV
jgi:hypothetical protein